MKKSKILFVSLIILIFLFSLGANYYKARIISSIAGPTLPVFPTSTEKAVAGDSQSIISPTPTTALDLSVKDQEKPRCNGPEQLIILVVGADNDYGYYRGLADVIQIYKVNFITAEVDILSIPRHLWVEIPGLEDQEIYEGKINQAYFYGNLYRLDGGGPTLLARTLYESFGLPVDHYFAINMVTFTNVVNQLGGIDFYNPEYASDDTYYFAEGNLHLNGEDALDFARIRKYDGVFARMDRQVLVVKAIAQKLLTPKYFLQLPSLINSNLDEVVTSLGEKEIGMLLCLAVQIDLDEVDNYSIGLEFGEHDWAFPSWAKEGTQILVPDFDKIRAYIQEFIEGP